MTDPFEYATAELRADLRVRIAYAHKTPDSVAQRSLIRILQSILRTFEAEVAFERDYAPRRK